MQRSIPWPLAAVLLFASCAAVPERSGFGPLPPDQIAWQRSLDDALAIARAERRPLLLAVNMDGES
ncbi:MAG: hypothetical protein JNK15_09095, partial [Planctomycetes bacterium]|nr:hypothetical protein [Planctomycetota bacterium]